jgi:hypothetical protein
MDISTTTAPKSDQINAEDLLAGPMTFTISEVKAGTAEQPVDIHLVELPGRPYRPSKSMRRVLMNAWGRETSVYSGRRLTLYRDATVKFGPEAVGGIKISHLSHISEAISLALTIKRGQRAKHRVDPLPDAPAAPSLDGLDADGLRALWKTADPVTRKAIEARVAQLAATETEATS